MKRVSMCPKQNGGGERGLRENAQTLQAVIHLLLSVHITCTQGVFHATPATLGRPVELQAYASCYTTALKEQYQGNSYTFSFGVNYDRITRRSLSDQQKKL